MKIARWVLLGISVVMFRVWYPEAPLPGPMRLDFHLVLIALIGLYNGARVGTIAGWGIGFLDGAPDASMIGWTSLLGSFLGWVVGYWGERLFLEYAISRLLILWLVLVFYKLIYLALAVNGDWSIWTASIWTGALASSGMSATVGVVVSLLWERARSGTGRRRVAGESFQELS